MAERLAEQILQRIDDASRLYHRLVLLVGPARAGKTKTLQTVAQCRGFPLLSVNVELSRRLLDLAGRQRALHTPALLGEIVAAHTAQVILLDNIEILFDASLKQDPLRLLQQLSRNRTVVAAWNGRVDDGHLIYAAPDHPEFRRYPAHDLLILTTGEGE